MLNKIELFEECNDDKGHCTLEPLPLTVETCGWGDLVHRSVDIDHIDIEHYV